MIIAYPTFIFLIPGSPFNIKVGGEPSGRIVEKIIKQRQAADVTHVGSQCELSLKVPGKTEFRKKN